MDHKVKGRYGCELEKRCEKCVKGGVRKIAQHLGCDIANAVEEELTSMARRGIAPDGDELTSCS